MRKIAIILGVVICLTFGVFVITGILEYRYVGERDVQTVLTADMGESVSTVIGYDEAWLFGYKVVKPILVDEKRITVVDFQGSPERKLNQAITHIKKYPYVESQADPTKITEETGGNCQAFSLLLQATLKHNGINAGVVLGKDHMYNWVELNGIKYLVDVVDGYIKEA